MYYLDTIILPAQNQKIFKITLRDEHKGLLQFCYL